jgi:two-component system, cell cycle sensor histidine kinase and response regulator CckA
VRRVAPGHASLMASEEAVPASEQPESLRILLIEDSAGDARYVRALLADVPLLQCVLEHEERLAPALERLRSGERWHALLLDLSLPDSHGVETLQAVLTARPELPVVILSGARDEALALEAVQRGAQDYLLKGNLDGPGIARALRYAVERRRVELALGQLRAEQAARRAAEAARRALAASEERYRSLVTFLPLGIVVQSHGRLVYLNPAAVELLGAGGESELLGRAGVELVDPDDRDAWSECVSRAIAGSPVGPWEARLVRTDGSTLLAEAFALPLVYEDQPATLTILQDVTARKAAEVDRELFLRGERLRSLGQLASGVAHDLNQSLGLVVGYGELAAAALGQPEPDLALVRDQLRVLLRAAQDGGETVKRLLAFARGRAGTRVEHVELESVLRDVAQLTEPRWRDVAEAEGRRINVHVETDGRPIVQGDAAALREALTNLVFNALDALPEGGTITLRAVEQRSAVLLEVVDTGHGMSPEVSARVFEPYFTTKGERGSGLGLAIVFGIVEQHGGAIDVASEPGKGTRFCLSFPRAGEPAPAPPSRRQVEEPGRALRILVVDDEPSLGRLAAHILGSHGHQVTVELSAERALEHLANAPFDLVVSDLGLGTGMNGWDLAAQVRERWPGSGFVLVTGWGAALELAEARLRGVQAIVAKPYRAAELLAAVREATSAGTLNS